MPRLFEKIRRAQFVYPRNFPEAPKGAVCFVGLCSLDGPWDSYRSLA